MKKFHGIEIVKTENIEDGEDHDDKGYSLLEIQKRLVPVALNSGVEILIRVFRKQQCFVERNQTGF